MVRGTFLNADPPLPYFSGLIILSQLYVYTLKSKVVWVMHVPIRIFSSLLSLYDYFFNLDFVVMLFLLLLLQNLLLHFHSHLSTIICIDDHHRHSHHHQSIFIICMHPMKS